MRRHLLLLGLGMIPAALMAQAAQTPATPAPLLPAAQQIAAAVLPLPAEFREDATVLGYNADSPKLATLRKGNGAFTCLATDPTAPRFHVACYHRSMEPFMARGRALRASGVKGERVDSVRFAEVKSGKLKMPREPAALYSLTGAPNAYDPATNTTSGARALFVIYIAGSTAASTGLSSKPQEGSPWIMFPGTPKAHIMLVPKM